MDWRLQIECSLLDDEGAFVRINTPVIGAGEFAATYEYGKYTIEVKIVDENGSIIGTASELEYSPDCSRYVSMEKRSDEVFALEISEAGIFTNIHSFQVRTFGGRAFLEFSHYWD